MVARTVEFLKEEQIGNICLFADADGDFTPTTHAFVEVAMWTPWRTCLPNSICKGPGRAAAMLLKPNASCSCGFLPAARIQARPGWREVSARIQACAVFSNAYNAVSALTLGGAVLRDLAMTLDLECFCWPTFCEYHNKECRYLALEA